MPRCQTPFPPPGFLDAETPVAREAGDVSVGSARHCARRVVRKKRLIVPTRTARVAPPADRRAALHHASSDPRELQLVVLQLDVDGIAVREIGRASCWERVCQSV